MAETKPLPKQVGDRVTGAILFFATAGVVLWQNLRLGILWDLSYILETSYRISLGDVPYRDFPIPFAPLTFLGQAALIRLTGRVYLHHVIYAAMAGGLATVLTWRIVLHLLNEKVPSARLAAFLLSLPLAFLGIYSVFPHPFYDCDCTLAILVAILLLLRMQRKNDPRWLALLAGAAVVVPLFVKQNAGLAFLAATVLSLGALMAFKTGDPRHAAGCAWAIAGAASGFALAVGLLYGTAGLTEYWHWTVQFAARRRLPPLGELLEVYDDPQLLWRTGAFLAGSLLVAFHRRSRPAVALLSIFLWALPFLRAGSALLTEKSAPDRADELLALWPFLLVISLASALWGLRRTSRARQSGIALVLPFIVVITVNGAFLSQQVWGSTYALWPLFMILCACTVSGLYREATPGTDPDAAVGRRIPALLVTISLVSASLLVSGWYYVFSEERLSYAKISGGEIARSRLPALAGLSIRGPWIREFEGLVDFTEQQIPFEDGLLMIPGEDLFYFTTGRRPRFPVLMFDHTVNPFSPEEIQRIARSSNLRWLIVKNELQVNGEPVEDKTRLFTLLGRDFQLVRHLGIYDIYRRADPL